MGYDLSLLFLTRFLLRMFRLVIFGLRHGFCRAVDNTDSTAKPELGFRCGIFQLLSSLTSQVLTLFFRKLIASDTVSSRIRGARFHLIPDTPRDEL